MEPVYVVIEIHRRVKLQVGDPRPVQHPGKRSVCPEGIVAFLFILPRECIRIVLAIHASKVSGKACFETEGACECVAVAEGHACSVIRHVRRHQLLHRARPLCTQIQHSVIILKVHSFGNGCLICTGIYREGYVCQGTSLARIYLDHSGVEIAILSRRDSGNYFNGLYVLHRYVSRVRSSHRSERRIVAESHSVNLYSCSEGCVSVCCSTISERKGIFGRQVRVDCLAAGQEGGNVCCV